MKEIKIVYYTETIDNLGRTESSCKPDYIYNALMNVDDWTDDMKFEDSNRNIYFIDDLQGKKVCVPGIGIFQVPNNEY
jgi:hypothetical protein